MARFYCSVVFCKKYTSYRSLCVIDQNIDFPNLPYACFTTLLTKASLSALIYIDLKNKDLNVICFLNSSLAFSSFVLLISLIIDCPSLA